MRWRSTAGARSKPRARAIAMVMDGASRTEAARAQGLELQVLRDRVLRSSTEGLVDRPRGGSEGRLTQAQVAEVGAWIEAGPDRERDGVTRRRVRDIVRKIEEAFGVVHTQKRCPHDASKGRVSLRLGAAGPPQGGCGPAEGVRGGLRGTVDVDAHRRGAGGPVEIGFQDEARVGRKGMTTRVWSTGKQRPRPSPWPRLSVRRHLRGVGIAHVADKANTASMNEHLAVIGAAVARVRTAWSSWTGQAGIARATFSCTHPDAPASAARSSSPWSRSSCSCNRTASPTACSRMSPP